MNYHLTKDKIEEILQKDKVDRNIELNKELEKVREAVESGGCFTIDESEIPSILSITEKRISTLEQLDEYERIVNTALDLLP